jgi:serine/threonine protein phosphatase 1
MRQFAISDIHGNLKTFQALLDQVAFTKSDELYLLGDYVDRGPDSKGVIDAIWQMQEEGYQLHCLSGNHEMIVIEHFDYYLRWKQPGEDTDQPLLDSFKAKNISNIPEKYIDWMRQLPGYFEIPGYILVHAGLDFSLSDPLLDAFQLRWIRAWHGDINYDWLGDRVIVHGHTPMRQSAIKTSLLTLPQNRFIDIDNGCFYHAPDFNHLCAFDLTNRELHFHKNVELTMKV